jgi:hypothetical protein
MVKLYLHPPPPHMPSLRIDKLNIYVEGYVYFHFVQSLWKDETYRANAKFAVCKSTNSDAYKHNYWLWWLN